MPRVLSLQKQLIKKTMLSSIVAGLVVWLLFLGFSSYQSMHLHDELMENVADVLLGNVNQHQAQHVDDMSEEFDIQYVLSYQQQVLTASEQQDLLSDQPRIALGFAFSLNKGRLLRRFAANEDGLSIQVVQPLSTRFHDIGQSSLSFVAGLLILWLLQWALLNWMVKRQLRPFKRISNAIRSKSAQDLSPIDVPQPELQELQPIVSQLNKMLARVEQSLVAEQRFTADASHELRSPLSAIHLRLQVLQRKYQDQCSLSQDLKLMQQDVLRGTQVLENLLLLARLDPEKPEQLQKKIVNLKQLVLDVQHALQPLADNKQITWQLNVAACNIDANEELIYSCIRNVVDNAIRYSSTQARLYIQTIVRDDAIQLLIEHSGEGVDEVVLQRLGERFFRALGNSTQGSGLGLSICKKIMDLHAGKLHFAPSSWGGLQVSLTFKPSRLA